MGGVTDIYSAYADVASLHTIGPGHVEMWGLYNFSRADVSIDGRPHHSTRSLREYDCNARRVRLLRYADYTEAMGTGTIIAAEDPSAARPPGRWEDVVRGAVDEAFWKTACAK